MGRDFKMQKVECTAGYRIIQQERNTFLASLRLTFFYRKKSQQTWAWRAREAPKN